MRYKIIAFIVMAVAVINTHAYGQHIYAEGTKLMRNGCPIYMNGANTPWQNWNDFGGSYVSSFWSSHFTEMSSYGLNSSRIWITCDGAGQPYIASDGTVSPPTNAFWEDMDDMLSHAQTNGIYVMATIMSFDHFDEAKPNHQGWRAMIQNKQKTQTFIDNYLLPLVDRYKDNPYLYNIDLCNEPEWIHEETKCGQIQWEHLQRFAGMCASAIHQSQSPVLVSIGSAATKWNSDRSGHVGNIWSDANLQAQSGEGNEAFLDFWHIHYYSWINQYFSNPFEKDPQYYMINDRPCIIGETPGRVNNGTDLYTIAGMTEERIFEDPHKLGYCGVYPWTSNNAGSGDFGSLATFGNAAKSFYDNHTDLVNGTCDNSTNAFLRELSLSEGAFTPNFAQGIFDYSIDIPEGNNIPQITASAADMNATVTIEQANSLPGNATVTIISQDKSTQNIYTIQMNSYTPNPTMLNVSPADIQVQLNKSQAFTAQVLDQKGKVLPNETITWTLNNGGTLSSNNGSATTFTSEGMLGDFVLTAESGDLKKEITITVSLGIFIQKPDSLNWIVTSLWEDQLNVDEYGAAYVSNNESALVISQRAWGYGNLFAINKGNGIELENNTDYLISFDFQDDAVAPASSITVGFCNAWSKEVTNQTATSFTVESGISSTNFSNISGTITASFSGESYLYILFSWGSDPENDKPSARYEALLKNLSIVPDMQFPDSDGDGTPDTIDKCPNDKNKIEPGECGCGIAEGTCDIPVNGIVLKKGWNLIGCTLEGTTNIEDALSSIWDNVESVKSMDNFYSKNYPEFLNLLKELEWGMGYLLSVSQDCVLIWENK